METLHQLILASQKVHRLDSGSADAVSSRTQAERYLGLAVEGIKPARAAIVITHGFAGSGKSTIAGILVERLDAVQLRSDDEPRSLGGR